MQVKSGSYTGNGSSQSISSLSLGGAPTIVLIKGGSNVAVACLSTFSADQTKPLIGATALFAGGVTSLDSDGFSLGSDARVNANGTTYHYLAVRDDGADIVTGTYSGDGTDDRTISVTLPTDFLMILPHGTPNVVFRSSVTSGDLAQRWDSQELSNVIQTYTGTGFQLGNRAGYANDAGVDYSYIAFGAATGLFSVVGWTGDGSDGRSITGAGFQPDNAFVKRLNSTNDGVARFKGHVGDTCSDLGAAADAANLIQAFESDGIQVGTDARVNLNLSTYMGLFFKDSGGGGGGGGQAPRSMQQQRLRRAA